MTYIKRSDASLQSTEGLMNHFNRQRGSLRGGHALNSRWSLLFIELVLVILSATSLSQSDLRGRWSTTMLHSKKAAIK